MKSADTSEMTVRHYKTMGEVNVDFEKQMYAHGARIQQKTHVLVLHEVLDHRMVGLWI
jgi:hypothetical protein